MQDTLEALGGASACGERGSGNRGEFACELVECVPSSRERGVRAVAFEGEFEPMDDRGGGLSPA